jgi:hypothetical protein
VLKGEMKALATKKDIRKERKPRFYNTDPGSEQLSDAMGRNLVLLSRVIENSELGYLVIRLALSSFLASLAPFLHFRRGEKTIILNGAKPLERRFRNSAEEIRVARC